MVITRRSFLAGVVAAAWVLGSGRSARAAVARRLSFEDLVRTSSRVIVGTPVSASSVWETRAGVRRIVTYSVVQVEEALDDVAGDSEVLVRTLGGVVGDIGQIVHGEAPLDLSRRAAMFLADSGSGSHRVVGWTQGYYRVAGANGAARLVADEAGAHLVGPEAGSARAALHGRRIDEARALVIEEKRRAAR